MENVSVSPTPDITNSRSPARILNQTRLNHWVKIAQKYLLEKEAGRWFTVIVVLPLLLATLYLGLIASERYVSNTTFMIERSDGASSIVDGLNLFGMAPQSGNDQKILENFIKSPDMLSFLDNELQLRKHYVASGDWFSSLSASANYDQFLQYYQEHINIRLNDSNGLLELEVQGFTPEFAQQLALLVLQRSESFVNEISHNMATEQQAFVQKEVGLNEDKLRDATSRVIRFQNKYGILSASEEGAALTGVLNELQAELVRNRAELQTLSSYLNGSSSQVVTLKQRIRALEKQLSVEKKRLTDDGRTSLNDLAARQQELQLELDLATKAYSSALIALETTRTEASRKLKQLVVISSPYIAEEAKYPRVLYSLVNLFLVLLMVFGLARMGYATVKEHRD